MNTINDMKWFYVASLIVIFVGVMLLVFGSCNSDGYEESVDTETQQQQQHLFWYEVPETDWEDSDHMPNRMPDIPGSDDLNVMSSDEVVNPADRVINPPLYLEK
jgi:hypothetical protein